MKLTKVPQIISIMIILTCSTGTFASDTLSVFNETYLLEDSLYYYLDNYGHRTPVVGDLISIKYISTASSNQISNLASNYNLSEYYVSLLDIYIYLNESSNMHTVDIAMLLENESIVERVELNFLWELCLNPNDRKWLSTDVSDSEAPGQWYLTEYRNFDSVTSIGSMGFPDVWDYSVGDPEVCIGIIDGQFWTQELATVGIMSDDFIENPWSGPVEFWWTDPTDPSIHGVNLSCDNSDNIFIVCDRDLDEVYDHGTEEDDPITHCTKMSSIIYSLTNNVQGMAGIAGGWFDVDEYYNVNAVFQEGCKAYFGIINYNNSFFTSATEVLMALDHMTGKKENDEVGIYVINMSFGGGYHQNNDGFFDAQIERAVDAGIFLVASTGNQGTIEWMNYPARHPEVFAVGMSQINHSSLIENREERVHLASQSYDPNEDQPCSEVGVQIVAPGATILVRIPDESPESLNGFTYTDGTSNATAIVSGVVGLMLSRMKANGEDIDDPDIIDIVWETLCRSADKIPGYNDGFVNVTHSYPYLDTYSFPYGLYDIRAGYGRLNALEAVAPPDLPLNFSVTQSAGQHPVLTWDRSIANDVEKYRLLVHRYSNNSHSSTQNYYIDNLTTEQYIDTGHPTIPVDDLASFYQIIAYDYTNQRSAWSNRLQIGDMDVSFELITVRILNNQYWAEGYIVIPEDSTVIVEEGATLTIGDGCTILCSDNSGIEVRGTLNVEGVNGNLVTFQPKDATVTSWDGIKFVEGSEGNLSYFEVKEADNCLTVISTDNVVIDHFGFEDGTAHGLYVKNVTGFVADDGTITDCGSYGIEAYSLSDAAFEDLDISGCYNGIKATQSDFDLEGSLITDNSGMGIYLTNCSSSNIDDCIISENGSYGMLLSNSEPYVTRTRFHENTYNGVNALSSSDFILGGSSSIYGNLFYNNGSSTSSAADMQNAEMSLTYSRPAFAGRHNDFVDAVDAYLLADQNYIPSMGQYTGAYNYWEGRSGYSQPYWVYPNGCMNFSYADSDTNNSSYIYELDELTGFDLAFDQELNHDYASAATNYIQLVNDQSQPAALDGWIRCQLALGNSKNIIITNLDEYSDNEILSQPAMWNKIRLQNSMLDFNLSIQDLDTFIVNADNEIDSLIGIMGQLETYYEMHLAGVPELLQKTPVDQPYETGIEQNLALKKLGKYDYPVPESIKDYFDKSESLLGQIAGEEKAKTVLIPEEFELYQAYPNPFNPSINIPFSVPEKANVTLAVYNVLGQKVKTLVDESMTAGYHRKIWKGVSESGIQVASGVYFVKMEAPNFVKSQKILLMK